MPCDHLDVNDGAMDELYSLFGDISHPIHNEQPEKKKKKEKKPGRKQQIRIMDILYRMTMMALIMMMMKTLALVFLSVSASRHWKNKRLAEISQTGSVH